MKAELSALANDPLLISSLKRDSFYATGIELIEAEACPFCDLNWNPEELKKHLKTKIAHLKEISRRRGAAERKIAPLIVLLQKAESSLSVLVRHGGGATPPLQLQALTEYGAGCKASAETLTSLLPLADSIAILANFAVVPPNVIGEIDTFERIVAALPEPTKQDASREWLAVAQERLEVWREAMRNQKAAKERAARARTISDAYAETSDRVLAQIYAAVEKDFATLYGFINRDDEDKFKAKLVPSLGKLGFDVDFYGRGFFPPGAYHSEGHQDSMGLCLYLALMRHLNGAAFTFAVLDDVLMSVDAGHRREVCTLLKQEFPHTQFILTTHDPIWLRHMKTEGLIEGRSAVQFRGWGIDEGPTRWDDRDVWTEIEDYLKQNDVRAAAALLRHYFEYLSAELCHRLRAAVEYRGDARYQLGELLPAAASRLRKLYSSAKDAASSWNQKDVVAAIAGNATAFGRLVDASNVEQWQVNVAVHFNSWDNLGAPDFAPVVKAFRDLLAGFTCSSCNEYLRVSPEREGVESLRCDCGKTNINLRKKVG